MPDPRRSNRARAWDMQRAKSMETEEKQPAPPPSQQLVGDFFGSSKALALQGPDISSSDVLRDIKSLDKSITASTLTVERARAWAMQRAKSMETEERRPSPPPSQQLVGDSSCSASALTLQGPDISSSDVLRNIKSLEESITASTLTVQRARAWAMQKAESMEKEERQPAPPPSQQLVGDFSGSASALTLQGPDISSSEVLRGTKSLDESITASTLTVPYCTTNSSSITSPTSCENLLIPVADSASTLALKVPDISSMDEVVVSLLEEPISANPQMALHNNTTDGSSSISSSTCERILRGVSPLEDLLDPTSLEELITAILPSVRRNTVDGKSCTFPSSCEKLVAGAAESEFAQTLQKPDEFLGSSSEVIAASTPTMPHNTDYGSLASVSSLGSKILRRSPPNFYQVFYIRMDYGGSFHMYPDLGGPFQSIYEADVAIDQHLFELHKSRCKRQDKPSIVDRMVHNCMYYLDGTPKKGPNSPSSTKKYGKQEYLIRALLAQYNECHNLSGNGEHELKDILKWQWFCEAHKWYYHFNFTTKTKEGDDKLFFAELSHMQGEVAYEVNCCRMVNTEETGHCNGCINYGSSDMVHPRNTSEYTGGHVDGYLPFGCNHLSSSDDEQDEEERLRFMFEGLDDPDVWDTLFPPNEACPVEH